MRPFTTLAREAMHKQTTSDHACLAPYGLRCQVRRDTAFAREGRTFCFFQPLRPCLGCPCCLRFPCYRSPRVPTTSPLSNSVLLNRLSPFTSHLSPQRSGGPGKNLKSPPNRANPRQSAPNSAILNGETRANIPKPPNTATKMARFGGLKVAEASRRCNRVASGVSRITNSVATHSRAILDESKPNR